MVDPPEPSKRARIDATASFALIVAEQWEGCTAGELARVWCLPAVCLFKLVGSTNDVARYLAGEHAPAGTLVIAEEQRMGRGRGSRIWASPPGLGLWCSLIGRDLSPEAIGTLPLRVALAVTAALDTWLPGEVSVKWPNDLVLRGKKLGGILCEAFWDGSRLDHVIIGIGLNLLQGRLDFPAELRSRATSLRTALGRPVSRFDVATEVIRHACDTIGDATTQTPRLATAAFAARDALYGLTIDILEPDTGRILLSGIARGIDPAGSLLVAVGDQTVPIRAGSVRVKGET